MNVIKPGSEVVLRVDSQLTAVVLQVAISGTAMRVSYEVAYWVGGDRKTAWMEDVEILAFGDAQKLPIGFASKCAV